MNKKKQAKQQSKELQLSKKLTQNSKDPNQNIVEEEIINYDTQSEGMSAFEMEQEQKTGGFFDGLIGLQNYEEQKLQSSNIDKSTRDEVLKDTEQLLNSRPSSLNDKVDKINQWKKRKHKYQELTYNNGPLDQNQIQQQQGEDDLNQASKLIQNQEEKQTLKAPQQIQLQNWSSLNLCKALLKACSDQEYQNPTIIQSMSIPAIMSGKDILGSSVTGSGKTAAFLLPIMQRYFTQMKLGGYQYFQNSNYIKVLIVTPTRELAFQCYEMFQNLNKYTKLRAALVIGAADMKKQETELRSYPEFVIATPGRLIDHLQNSKSVDLDQLEVLIFDEADKLLDMGFKAEVEQISERSNQDRQTLMFSATLNDDVNKLIKISMKKPIRIQANLDQILADKLQQKILKIQDPFDREAYLLATILTLKEFKKNILVFFKTKKQCHRMAIIFGLLGLHSIELHGNLSQQQRISAFEDFKQRKYDFLMATDLAARGLDIKDLNGVINYEMPAETTRYIHRVGRTARAGQAGISLSIATDTETRKLKKLLKKERQSLEYVKINEKLIKKYKSKIQSFEQDIQKIEHQESIERYIRKAEIQATRAENMIEHQEDIYNRPKKTWFQSNRERNLIKTNYNQYLNELDDEKTHNKKFKQNNQH